MIRTLPRYRLFAILGLLGMLLFFTVLYFITTSRLECRVGSQYMYYSEENGNAVYSSKSGSTKYIVSADRIITYQSGGKNYGTYTVQISEDNSPTASASSVEIWHDGQPVSRGSDARFYSDLILLSERPNQELTHCGDWGMWWLGTIVTLMIVAIFLFAKEERLDIRGWAAIAELLIGTIMCYSSGLR